MISSIRAIAQETGYSPSTVSRALRGSGRISSKVREVIRKAAKKAGYQVHPLLAQALSLARQPKTSRYRETLGFIIEYPMNDCPDFQTAVYAGAEQRAASLAYKLEAFVLSGNPSQHRRWSAILRNRGIRGLIIMPRLEHRQPRLRFDWEHFAAVEIGRTLWNPLNLHRVESAEYPKILESIHVLKKVGYRRIGMAIEPMQNQHQYGVYYAVFLLMQQKLPPGQRVPILAMEGGWNEKNFRRWMRRYKPDVLIGHRIMEICVWLQKLGLRIPDDVSIFRTDVREDDPPGLHRSYQFSGLRRDNFTTGRRAVEMVSNLLESGELGLVGNPMCWQVSGLWVPGQTLSRSISSYISSDGFLRTQWPRSALRT